MSDTSVIEPTQSTQPKRKLKSRGYNLTPDEIAKVLELRKKGLSGYDIAPIVNAHPRTIYDVLHRCDIKSEDFKRVKRDWGDLVKSTAAKTLGILNEIVEGIDISELSESEKASAFRNLSVGMGAALDQAPKISVNVSLSFHDSNVKLLDLENQEKALQDELSAYQKRDASTIDITPSDSGGDDMIHPPLTPPKPA